MRGLLTTQEQGGWRELIHKEAYCRINWKAKYGHKYPRRMPDYGISKRKCFLPAICLPEEEKSSIQHQEGVVPKVQQLPAEKDGPSRQEPLPEMRAPTPRTAQLLYHGVSHEGNGRHLYLKERKTKGPEEKFCYPLVSSWEYGWRLGDVIKDIKTPIHGKSRIVRDTFYSRNGIFCHPSKTDQLL